MADNQATEKEKVTSISMAIVFGPQLNSFCIVMSTVLSRFMYDSLTFIFIFRTASCRSRDPKSDRRVSRYRLALNADTGGRRVLDVEVLCSNSVLQLSLFCGSIGPYHCGVRACSIRFVISEAEVHKSRTPGRPSEYILYGGSKYLRVPSMELDSCQPSVL